MCIPNVKYRNIISKLRLSANNLAIERGRHQNFERHTRLGKSICCDIVIVCPKYTYETTLKQLYQNVLYKKT